MGASKKAQTPPPESMEENRSSESDGIEKRDPSIAKKRKISDLQRTPPRSEPEGKDSRPASETGKKNSRVFSEEDEVTILNHVIEFKKEHGVDPVGDMDRFHKLVIDYLVADVNKSQLYEKIRRLRDKFYKNTKMVDDGGSVDFKRHDKTLYDLSKEVWGDGVKEDDKVVNLASPRKSKPKNDAVKSNGVDIHESGEVNGAVKRSDKKSKKKSKRAKDSILAAPSVQEVGLEDDVDFEKEYPYTVQAYASMASRGVITAEQAGFLKANLSAAGDATREFEEKWKELLEKETEVAVQKLEMFAHHSRQVLAGMNK